MDTSLVIDRARTIFESADNRLKVIEEFFAASDTRGDGQNYHDLILRFSKFLTLKGVINWSDVTPSIVQSFIILNQHEDQITFNSKEWIEMMKEFFDFLVKKNILKNNIFINEERLLNNDFNERLSPERICSRCGVKINSNIAKYCNECSALIKREITLQWNKSHPDRVKKATREWRERNKEKIKERRLKKITHADAFIDYSKWQDILRVFDSSLDIRSPSPWAENLRGDKTHLLWMVAHSKRMDKIIEIEKNFGIYWEDKLKEVYENYNRKQAAKILELHYLTLLDWAKHLKLCRVCDYCNKKLSTAEGRYHPNCKLKNKPPAPQIKMDILNIEDKDVIDRIKNLLPAFPKREAFIIENRYFPPDGRKTLRELGEKLNISRERVRQIEKKVIVKLKQRLKKA